MFYLIYALLLKNDTFHRIQRYYLLITVIFSLTIPQVPSFHFTKGVEKMIQLNENISNENLIYNDTFEKIVFGNIPNEVYSNSEHSYTNYFALLVLLLYAIGLIIMLTRFLLNISHLKNLIKSNAKKPLGENIIVSLPDNYPTFSFFNYIFFNDNNLTEKERDEVLLHEKIHIKQRHSTDIIFIEICKIFLWFNPFIWLYKNSLLKVHECLVDNTIIKNRNENIETYQSLLLKQYLSNYNIELAHPFNYSLIKFRIKMMTKTKTKWWTQFKLILVFPIALLSLISFTNRDLDVQIENLTKSESREKLMEPEPSDMVFVPMGSFVLKRTNGNVTKELNVSTDAFWMKETEVSVKEYNVYLESLRKNSSKEVYNSALPDINKAPFKDYFSEKKYLNFPMVGITFTQANNFCKWKTETENAKLKSDGKPPVDSYRLPTEVEWIYASFGMESPDNVSKIIKDYLDETKKSEPNNLSLYNMFDNVSEWTDTPFNEETYLEDIQASSFTNPNMLIDKIIVKGENYKSEKEVEKIILNGNLSYGYVGFRYVRTYLGRNYGE